MTDLMVPSNKFLAKNKQIVIYQTQECMRRRVKLVKWTTERDCFSAIIQKIVGHSKKRGLLVIWVEKRLGGKIK